MFIDRPTRTYIVENGEARMHIVDPEAYGFDSPLPETSWTPAEQIRVTEAVLRGDGELGFTGQALLNAAVRLHLGDRAGSVEEGIYICKAHIDSGAAWRLYENWRGAMLGGSAGGSGGAGSAGGAAGIPATRA